MSETFKRVALWVLSLGGWGWAIGVATWAIIEFDPQHGRFAPQWTSLSVFLSMGVAIAAGVSIGRINSVRTLARIFDAGMMAQKVRDEKDDDEHEENTK